MTAEEILTSAIKTVRQDLKAISDRLESTTALTRIVALFPDTDDLGAFQSKLRNLEIEVTQLLDRLPE